MNLVCSVMGHKRAATKSWDGEFYHSHCVRCSAALVRLSGDRVWREPDADEQRYFERMKDQPAIAAEVAAGVTHN